MIENQLLGCVVCTFLAFKEHVKLFSRVTAILYSFQHYMTDLISPYPSQHLLLFFVFLLFLFNHVCLFATPWTAARQASLSITNSCNLLKLMSTESVRPSNHLILCHPLLLLPSVFPRIGVFSNELALCIR